MPEITLPSEDPDFVLLFYQRLGQPDAGSFTYRISEATHAIRHMHSLLSLLVTVSMEAANTYDATPAFQTYMAWILDSYSSSHEMQKRWKSTSILHDACNGSNEKSISSVQALLSSLESSMSDAIIRKGYVVLSIFCADMLDNPSELTCGTARLNICRSILKLAVICQQHDSIYRAVSLRLLPAIKSYLEDSAALGSLGNDFNVSCLLLIPCSAKCCQESCSHIMWRLQCGCGEDTKSHCV
jgi:serine/threonine-protein kinase ATR